ncbi:MAG: mucoidy inhibitor MuiA family protein [Deltaproteobacteria bacterium]|nr:mucoidy inhibitor MuiA family protein [Deltaproteobacteria bacterium]
MKIELPIQEVTLLEDRAHVVRTGRVEVEAGKTTLVIEDVAPVIVDKTLAVKIEEGAASCGKARVLRRRVVLAADKPEELAALDERLRALQAEHDLEEARRDLLQGQLALLGELSEHRLGEIAEDAGWERIEIDRWTEQGKRLHEESRGCQQAILVAEQKLEKLDERAADLRRQRAALASPTLFHRSSIELELHAESAGELKLRLTYLVPGACWRPYHRAQLVESAVGARLHFESDGCVWQNTGEDWSDVQLYFSTERPSLGVEVPRLSTDTLHARKVGSTVAVEAREEKIHTSGLGGGGKVSPEVPGIDDGGEVRKLKAKALASVPSDGRPYRVPVLAFESPAKVELRLAAELTPAVILRSEQKSEASLPLLAGPVDLVRESGPVGRTSILYVAPGETFELGWGPEASLRVHREQRELDEESRLLSSWTKARHRVTVRLSNIGPQARTVSVRERIPVSEVEKVKIELERKETTGEVRPDADGLLEWTVELKPYGREKIELGYEVARHSDVVGL